jgi:N-acetylglucosamine malate deacetylase 1
VSQAEETVVLALGAHPDDVEGTCGGTLALLARRGVPVHVALLTGGETGIAGESGEHAREIRLGEARRAAEAGGLAGVHHLGEDDSRSRLIALLRTLRVNLLITHPPSDYHADHRAAAELALDARIAAGASGAGNDPPLEWTIDLVFMDSEQGLDFEPHVWIDIDDAIAVKRAMLRAHESQLTLLHGESLVELTDSLGRLRGGQRGCGYAEAFRGCGTWPAPDAGIRRLVLLLEGGEGS